MSRRQVVPCQASNFGLSHMFPRLVGRSRFDSSTLILNADATVVVKRSRLGRPYSCRGSSRSMQVQVVRRFMLSLLRDVSMTPTSLQSGNSLESRLALREVFHKCLVKPHARVEFDEVRSHRPAGGLVLFAQLFQGVEVIRPHSGGVDGEDVA